LSNFGPFKKQRGPKWYIKISKIFLLIIKLEFVPHHLSWGLA
jgi:hypothetical protein